MTKLNTYELETELKKLVKDYKCAGYWCEFHSRPEHKSHKKCGLWMSAEEGNIWTNGMRMFDYWGYDMDYKEEYSIMHVNKDLYKWLEERGCIAEYYDTGTVTIYPDWMNYNDGR